MFNAFAIDWLPLVGTGVTSYILETIEGLDAPDYRLGAYERPGEDGGVVGSEFFASRIVTLTGHVYGPDAATYNQNRRNLGYVCGTRKDSNGFPVAVPFTFTLVDGVSYFFNGYIKSFRMQTQYQTFGQFIISIIVPDPMVYGTQSLTSGQVSRPSGGGAIFPWTFPVTFGSSTGGSASINNFGTADTWPILTLRGIVSNPYMYSQQRGKNMKLNYTTTNVTDVITIDMKNKTILLNSTVNLLSAKDTASDWFSLPYGVSTILFNTSSSGDTGTLEVTAYPAYVGV